MQTFLYLLQDFLQLDREVEFEFGKDDTNGGLGEQGQVWPQGERVYSVYQLLQSIHIIGKNHEHRELSALQTNHSAWEKLKDIKDRKNTKKYTNIYMVSTFYYKALIQNIAKKLFKYLSQKQWEECTMISMFRDWWNNYYVIYILIVLGFCIVTKAHMSRINNENFLILCFRQLRFVQQINEMWENVRF